jgi:LL-diaminopimelate aminotransferase
MSESYIQNLFAERIGGKNYGKGTQIYKFEKIKRAKRAAAAAHPGVELIDMGVGEPDEMAFPDVVRSLAEEAAKTEN